ncbi:DnaJ domain-containing protein [Candidatus Woesearchaeota archaeon]|nr:DnaJ domain-containing protein [Candidatus Woesearchaeota archaeon]
MKTKTESLEQRAKKVLGLAEQVYVNIEEIKRAYKKKAFKYHPDKNPEDSNTIKKFQLILEAKIYLRGKKDNSKLLEDNDLVEEFIGEPIEELGKTYQEWLHHHFYDMKNKSIWP